jgi:hypothetical protein
MKETGQRTSHMDQENKNGEMVFIIKVTSWMGRKREMENISIKNLNIQVFLKITKLIIMDKQFSSGVTPIEECGKMGQCMVMVFIHIKMVHNIKVTLLMARKMVKENIKM